MKKAISYLLVFLGIQMLVGGLAPLLLPLVGHAELVTSPYTQIAVMVIFSVITLIVFISAKWAVPSRGYLLSRPWMTVFWSVIGALGAVIPSVAFQEVLPDMPNWMEAEMIQLMNTTGSYFVVCLLVPLVEELVFRGSVLRALLVWKPEHRWGMIALSALLFALAHMNPAQMIHAFLIGMLLGWMYERTRSIVPSVSFHATNNTVAFLMTRLYPNPDLHLVDIFGSNQRVVMAVLFSLFILLPAIYQLNVWMKNPEFHHRDTRFDCKYSK